MTGLVTSGVVAFSNLTECEVYQGQSTGRYSLVITMDEASASPLGDMGVKLKEYDGKKQRKFASKFHVQVVDTDDQPVNGEIPYGSKVRVLWKAGDAHPQHGVGTYLNKVRVVEFAENGSDEEEPSDF
jgi:hypothetical protein